MMDEGGIDFINSLSGVPGLFSLMWWSVFRAEANEKDDESPRTLSKSLRKCDGSPLLLMDMVLPPQVVVVVVVVAVAIAGGESSRAAAAAAATASYWGHSADSSSHLVLSVGQQVSVAPTASPALAPTETDPDTAFLTEVDDDNLWPSRAEDSGEHGML